MSDNVVNFPCKIKASKKPNQLTRPNIKGGYFFVKIEMEIKDGYNDIIFPPEIKVMAEDNKVFGALSLYLLSIADEIDAGSSLVEIERLYNELDYDDD